MSLPIVPGYGNPNAHIILVGEAPAANEVREGRPFVGKAGQELNRLLSSAGIDRESLYVTNACLSPVQGDKDDWFFESNGAPTPQYLTGIASLIEDLQRIRPNVVVPLGNYALWALMQHQDVMKWRGSILWSDLMKVKVVPTIHPAALLWHDRDTEYGGMYKWRPVIIWDLERAREQAEFPDLRRKERTLLIDPQGVEFQDAITRLRSAKELVFDIESFGGLNLACIGFGDGDPAWAVTIPYEGRPDRFALYKELIESPVPKSNQNIMYDVTFLDQLGIHTRNVRFDTMAAQHVILTDLPKGLDFLTSIYTDVPYYKDEGKVWKRPTTDLTRFWRYNATDICTTTESMLEQRQQFAEDPQLHATFLHEMGVFEPLRVATREGFPCDMEKLRSHISEVEQTRDRLQAELDKIAGRVVNVFSHTQVKELIYGERGLPVRTRKGKVTSAANVLMDLAAKTHDPALTRIVRIRRARKLLSVYYREDIVSPDGRVRYTYNIAGTKTGRLSADKPLWGPGIPIQTIPKRRARNARGIFIAKPGWEIGEFDQVQAEAVITAYLANDPIHMDCFRTGKDVHRVTACLMSDLPPENWEKVPKEGKGREIAKRCNHAFNYGIGPITFMYTVNEEWDPDDPDSLYLQQDQAEAIHAKYLQTRPALKAYWEWVRSEIQRDRTLRTPLGRRRIFLDAWSDTLLRDAYSWIPQSTVGDATNLGIIKVWHNTEFHKTGTHLLVQGHDSAVWTWPKECRDTVVPIIMRQMQIPLLINGTLLCIAIDGAVGPSWDKDEMEPLGVTRKSVEITPQEYGDLQDETTAALNDLA